MKLLAAVALSRPERAAAVAETLRRQKARAQWLVVENGSAEGSFVGSATVVTSRMSAGAARNAALAYARARDFDWVSFFDDDDYYGPHYLAEIIDAANAGDADVLHKGVGFVRFDTGLWLFNSATAHVMANTLSVRVSRAPEFLEIAEPEEPAWTRAAIARGMRIRRLPPWHHVWNRSGNPARHVFKGGAAALRAAFGAAKIVGDKPDAYVDLEHPTGDLQTAPQPSAEELFADLERHAASSGWGTTCS